MVFLLFRTKIQSSQRNFWIFRLLRVLCASVREENTVCCLRDHAVVNVYGIRGMQFATLRCNQNCISPLKSRSCVKMTGSEQNLAVKSVLYLF